MRWHHWRNLVPSGEGWHWVWTEQGASRNPHLSFAHHLQRKWLLTRTPSHLLTAHLPWNIFEMKVSIIGDVDKGLWFWKLEMGGALYYKYTLAVKGVMLICVVQIVVDIKGWIKICICLYEEPFVDSAREALWKILQSKVFEDVTGFRQSKEDPRSCLSFPYVYDFQEGWGRVCRNLSHCCCTPATRSSYIEGALLFLDVFKFKLIGNSKHWGPYWIFIYIGNTHLCNVLLQWLAM